MKKVQAYHPYALAALLFLGIITNLSCHKAEQPLPVTSDTTSSAFFQVPRDVVPAVSVIIHAMNRLNEKSPFAETMIHNAGQPQWAFAKIKSNSSARETTGEQIINIPFVKEGTFKTSAILSVDIAGADTSYNLFYPQHYLRYALGDDATNADQQTAKDFFSVFAGFDHDLFGITEYRVNDGRVFGFDKEDKVEVTVSYPGETAARQAPGSSPNMAAADYIQICKTIRACVVATARCVSSVQCAYVWQEEGGTQPPPTTPSGGGSSGKPIAGGGSGTGGMLVPPCARSMNANGRELIASDPCGDPWTPSPYEVDCNSFVYIKTSTANWQEAGVNQIRLNWVWVGEGKMISRMMYIDHMVFGLPKVYNSGEQLSPGAAATRTARIVQEAKKLTYMEFDNSPYYPRDEEVTQYFKAIVHELMTSRGGTAGATGSGSPLIVFKNEERSNWTNPYDCE